MKHHKKRRNQIRQITSQLKLSKQTQTNKVKSKTMMNHKTTSRKESNTAWQKNSMQLDSMKKHVQDKRSNSFYDAFQDINKKDSCNKVKNVDHD